MGNSGTGWTAGSSHTERGLRDERLRPPHSRGTQPDDSRDSSDDPHGLPHDPWLPAESQNLLAEDCPRLGDNLPGPAEDFPRSADSLSEPSQVEMGVRMTRTAFGTTPGGLRTTVRDLRKTVQGPRKTFRGLRTTFRRPRRGVRGGSRPSDAWGRLSATRRGPSERRGRPSEARGRLSAGWGRLSATRFGSA